MHSSYGLLTNHSDLREMALPGTMGHLSRFFYLTEKLVLALKYRSVWYSFQFDVLLLIENVFLFYIFLHKIKSKLISIVVSERNERIAKYWFSMRPWRNMALPR